MKKKTLDSCIHKSSTNPIIRAEYPLTIRSDPAVSSDHLVDVHEAKRLLKTLSAKKLYYHCAKGHLLFIRQEGKLYFSEAVLRKWHDSVESGKRHKLNH